VLGGLDPSEARAVVKYGVRGARKQGVGHDTPTMDKLVKYIEERLALKTQCTVFSQEVSRIWPMRQTEIQKRDKAIQAFAKKWGLSATIRDSGIRVIFRKVEA
jgi:hypothetical protein